MAPGAQPSTVQFLPYYCQTKFTFCPLHAKILFVKILAKAILLIRPFSLYDKEKQVFIALVALKLLQNPTGLMSITSTQLLVYVFFQP